MALVTYILLSTLIAGLRGQFQPELLGYTATIGLAVVIVEIVALKLGCYLLSISSQSQLFDLIAYSGYKFVGIIVTIVVAELVNGGKGTGGWVGWAVFFYTFLANSLFLVSSHISLSRSATNCSSRCARSSTFSSPSRRATPAARCRRTQGPSGTRGRSSSSSTPTSSSYSSCGSSPGLERTWRRIGRTRCLRLEVAKVTFRRQHRT